MDEQQLRAIEACAKQVLMDHLHGQSGQENAPQGAPQPMAPRGQVENVVNIQQISSPKAASEQQGYPPPRSVSGNFTNSQAEQLENAIRQYPQIAQNLSPEAMGLGRAQQIRAQMAQVQQRREDERAAQQQQEAQESSRIAQLRREKELEEARAREEKHRQEQLAQQLALAQQQQLALAQQQQLALAHQQQLALAHQQQLALAQQQRQQAALPAPPGPMQLMAQIAAQGVNQAFAAVSGIKAQEHQHYLAAQQQRLQKALSSIQRSAATQPQQRTNQATGRGNNPRPQVQPTGQQASAQPAEDEGDGEADLLVREFLLLNNKIISTLVYTAKSCNYFTLCMCFFFN